MPIVRIIVALVVILGGGASVAAQYSLPGDFFYPVKVHVNEEVRAAFAFSSQARAAWEERRAESRLEEAEEVTVKSTLSADVRAQIEEQFSAQADRVRTRMAALESTDVKAAAELSSVFETSLQVHQQILARLAAAETDANERAEVSHLSTNVASEAKIASENRARLEAKVYASAGPDVKAAAEGKQGATQNKIKEVQNFIDLQKQKLGAEATVAAQTRLNAAQTVMANGTAKLQAGAYGDAFLLFQQAERMAQEAQLLLEASSRLQIDVNTGVSAGGLLHATSSAGVQVKFGY